MGADLAVITYDGCRRTGARRARQPLRR